MTRREEIEIKALSEYRIKEKENKKAIGTYDANIPRRKAFIEGAEWADKTMIERICEWVENHIFDFPWYDSEQSDFSSKDIANALRKAMEE